MNEIIDKILIEWAKDVPDGQPDPKNPYHLVILKESMDNIDLPEWFDKEWLMRELRSSKEIIS